MIECNALEYFLSDSHPATRFGEAFPIGNGHIGGMVYGTTPINKIALSGNTFFSGSPDQDNCQKDAAHSFYKMRRAAQKGDFKKVHLDAEGFIGKKNDYGTNLPIGNLILQYGSKNGKVELVSRCLSIQTGIASRKMQIKRSSDENNSMIEEEVFVSNPAGYLVIAGKSTDLFDLTVGLENLTEGEVHKISVGEEGNVIDFFANAHETMHCDQKTGVHLAGKVTILSDGIFTKEQSRIAITDCTWVHSYVEIGTDYLERIGREDHYKSMIEHLYKKNQKRMIRAAIQKKSYSCIKEEHIQDINELFNRNQVKILDHPEVNFLYQYGRYLLFSSVRENSILPPHLQGIWNDEVACRIGWTCDMHLDINTQMNYWPALVSGLAETVSPLLFWIENMLFPEGRKTASMCYGIQGTVGEIVSNAWGFAAPYWAAPIAPCPTGGVWILTQLWEYYLYTEDSNLLYTKIYPLYKESIAFFKEYIFLDEKGYYQSGPSISPENSFLVEGELYQISVSPTYEIIMIRELFDQYCKMITILVKNGMIVLEGTLKEEYHLVQTLRDALLPYRIKEDGSLCEYSHDYKIPDAQHRHTSHLLGVFPFSQITPEETPDLAKAVEKTIQDKLTPKEGFENTGWASSMLALYEARLGHGGNAFLHLKTLMGELKEPNHLIFHPPTRGAAAFDHVYELDGNTGFTSAVAEMLLQSHKGVIHILPALPKEWESGKVTGLHARGNLKVDIKWSRNEAEEIGITSRHNQLVQVRTGNQILDISLTADKQVKLMAPFQ